MTEILIPFCKKQAPSHILIMDNASPHLSAQAIKEAIKHQIEFFTLVPPASALLQPFDQLFSSLKHTFSEMCTQFCLIAAAFIVNKTQFFHVLHSADRKSVV